jgi:ABC-type sugar transport system ATPase subunit
VHHVHSDSIFDFRPRGEERGAGPKFAASHLENILDGLVVGTEADSSADDPVPIYVAASGPLAAKLAGKEIVIVGIRPEHFEDVSVIEDGQVDSSRTFAAHIDVREWLGDQQYAYVPYEAEAKVQDQLKELARESDSDSLRTQLVVSLDAASSAAEDSDTTLYIDTDKMHLFDPASGDNLTVGL